MNGTLIPTASERERQVKTTQFNSLLIYMFTQRTKGQLQSKQEQRDKQTEHVSLGFSLTI
jgi:hypothetical protein